MEIEYNKSEVAWCNNGDNIKYRAEGIEFATEDDNKIYIELLNNDLYEYHYVNFKGELILSYGEVTENVTFIDLNLEKKVIKIPLIEEVAFGDNDKIFILAGIDKEKKLIELSLSGEKINEYFPPSGYTFYRIGSVENEINIVCQGNISTQDIYGRNDWNFILNLETGDWIKRSLAY